ncbi:MAG: Unknown protein [uncultured Sulfurovum sp.]|uniref:Uncharacterized protein n=1 Tax=uncultured Sulfurovum sp. TaxID=269237 RepID=A0A6S6SVJ0_9BACT|nr:MAG: Unknown protein [uncultured Sulfurovum sp.]
MDRSKIIASVLETKENCDTPLEKIEFDGSIYYICFSEKVKSSLRQDFAYLILFAISGKGNKRYYHDKKRNSLYLFESNDDTIEIDILPVDKNASQESVASLSEAHFNFDSAEVILESPKELKSIYGKKHLKNILLLLFLMAILGTLLYVIFQSDIKKKPPKPYHAPLSKTENTYLLNLISKQTIDILNKEIASYSLSIDKINRTRIVGFNLSRIEMIPRVEPIYDEEKNIWYYPGSEFPKRGGYTALIEILLEQTFAGVGFTLKEHTEENTVYGKVVTKTINTDERNLSEYSKQNLILTKQCLEETLILTEDTIPTKREDRSIEFIIDKTSGSTIIKEVQKSIEHCPLTIKSLMLTETRFRIEAILRNDIESK